MNSGLVSPEEFLNAINSFYKLSQSFHDSWILIENKVEQHKSYLKKEEFIKKSKSNSLCLWKAEYVIFYNISYGVPAFSFNIWNSEGALLSLEDIRHISPSKITEADFYSVVTQQEHPILLKPYFIVHPCHTESVLLNFRYKSKNIIVTFLSIITPIVNIHIAPEFGL